MNHTGSWDLEVMSAFYWADVAKMIPPSFISTDRDQDQWKEDGTVFRASRNCGKAAQSKRDQVGIGPLVIFIEEFIYTFYQMKRKSNSFGIFLPRIRI
jgi:microcystin degradation protein MlrC